MLASRGGIDKAAVLRVERDVRGALGQERLDQRLGCLVDREGDVAAGAGAVGVGAPGVRSEQGEYALAQRERELADEVPHPRLGGSAGRGASLTFTVRCALPRYTSSVTVWLGDFAPIRFARSSAWFTARPSTFVITSPALGMSFWPWKVILLFPAEIPAFDAGLPDWTLATSAPRCTGTPRRCASCG